MNRLSQIIRIHLSDREILTESDIDDALNLFCNIGPEYRINQEDKHSLRNELLSMLSIRLDRGILLKNNQERHQPWFLDRKKDLSNDYWDAYKEYLLTHKKFPSQVVNRMDKVLDELTDLLGDPTIDHAYSRKGLVIGDVQSGKTANYTGLICKAADVGYKVIVLLAGITDNLRVQTQKRLDEGFLGVPSSDPESRGRRIGVGTLRPNNIPPISLTTDVADFTVDAIRANVISLESTSAPILFVIKKNVNVLRQLNRWIDRQKINNKINHSLLLIDDEADNASINTRDDEDPTATNREIRRLFNSFARSSYVGYTATPYANIFINPETDQEMEHADLFPSDYIYCLEIPSNYIGARNIFGSEDASSRDMLVTIDETENKQDSILHLLPTNHRREGDFNELPTDLKEAINSFLLANVIEDLEGKLSGNHRTMLINISRFRDRHQQISDVVWGYVKRIQSDCENYCNLDAPVALQNSSLNFLHQVFNKIYPTCPIRWEEIQKNLHNSISGITIKTINYLSEDKLDYDRYHNGLRVIVIGGLTLSRGLTLEGLVTTYFYRNSKMYDTLMQMGRWFGYRDGYSHLCRIWMSSASQDWYHEISEATDELRRDIQKYKDTELTPLDFGLRVRSDKNSLLVTARNKMRNATQITRQISFSGEYIETPRLISDPTVNSQNIQAVRDLIETLIQEQHQIQQQAGKYGFVDVDKQYIINLLEKINISQANMHFDRDTILHFIEEHYQGRELEKWDIVWASGSSSIIQDFGHGIVYPLSTRKYSLENDGKIIKMSGGSTRLGSTGDVKFGLTHEQINEVEEEFRPKTPSAKGFFQLKRNPLLVIYMVELGTRADSKETDLDNILKKNHPYIGFGIGFPILQNTQTRYASYVLNPVAIREQERFDDEEGDE